MRPRPLALAALLLLPGCGVETGPLLTVGAGIGVASLTLIGRTPADAAVSLVSGLDCSIARLDLGLSYCAPVEPAPGPPPFCTRSLGHVDCWVSRPPAVPAVRGVVDGPSQLSPAQDANRTARWPAGRL